MMQEDTPTVKVVSIDTLVQEHLDAADSMVPVEEDLAKASLLSHIWHSFTENREARETGLVNRHMLEALRAYNGQYDPEDWQKIQAEGGSTIYMNLTTTKVRAAISWIKDILLAGKEDAYSISITPDPELPEEMVAAIERKVEKDFESLIKPAGDQTAAQAPPQPGQPAPQQMPPGQQAAPDVAETLKEMQEYKRDLYEAIQNEIEKEASFAFKIVENKIKDSLKEGKWENALSEFIDDFCIFPTAILKGPVVCKKKRLKWQNGQPVVDTEYVMYNKRISPLDAYPAPEAETVMDGNFIEHLRMSRKEVAGLYGTPKYDPEAVQRVLADNKGMGYPSALDTNIEDEKAREEFREDTYKANKNVFHGLHFWGTASCKILREWGMKDPVLNHMEEEQEVDIEAIVIGDEIVKCVLNDDPLGRRPYYAASYMNRPGSFWGAAPPWMMRDIQKMCNATARALSNNMGLSSGPLMELVVDRLADGQEISELRPRDVIQTTSDPSGGSGRAVNFFTIPSVAQELLAVYREFEVKADDVTMIPRYSYGNEKVGGAAQTASGLSMLLESANKGIKDAIRHIDEGVIIPRIEMEFYTLMLKESLPFSGDIQVIARGSQALTLKGAEQMRRNEFLQVTANPIDQKIMGATGRAEILRTMAKDLNLGEDVIPNRQEIKKKEKEEQQAASNQTAAPVKAAEIQNQTIKAIADDRLQIDVAEHKRKVQKDEVDAVLKSRSQEQAARDTAAKVTASLENTRIKEDSNQKQTEQAIALSLKTGDLANNV